MCDVSSFLERLAQLALPDGGWGYQPDQAMHLEPTCLALLALSLEVDRYQAALESGQLALAQCATGDGAYRLVRGRDEALWPTALVLFVQAALDYPAEDITRTAGRLLQTRGRAPTDVASPDMIDIDFKLIGWPWADNNFSWAEPTAWACLALRRAGHGDHPRVAEGLKLLLNRALDDGGINYGNKRIFGRATEPQPGPTALMLLALQATPADPRIEAAVEYLRQHALASDDLEHLCWARLALDAYHDRSGMNEAASAIDQRIADAYRKRADTPWLRPAPMREALTALALSAGKFNYFRLKLLQPAMQTPAEARPVVSRRPLSERLRSVFRGMALQAVGRLRQPAGPAEVHIARADNYDSNLVDILARSFESFRDRVPLAGKRIVLKPNLVEYHRGKVINTDPRVVNAVIELCQREGAAEVIVAEGPGHCRNVEYLVEASGLGDVLRARGVRFVDINHDEPIKRLNIGRLTGLEYLYLARTVINADVLISLPKLKTHHWAGATLSLKNLFGTLPGICYGWPKNELHWRGIDRSIVDIALTRTPELAIVDGIIGMEGDGPLNGTPKQLGALVMGTDLLAVDATCCRLMQLDPERIGYLVLGQQRGLGCLREGAIKQTGETITSLARPFETLPQFRPLYLGRSA